MALILRFIDPDLGWKLSSGWFQLVPTNGNPPRASGSLDYRTDGEYSGRFLSISDVTVTSDDLPVGENTIRIRKYHFPISWNPVGTSGNIGLSCQNPIFKKD